MDAREKLMQILDKPVFPEGKDPLEAVADYLLENDVVPVAHAHWNKEDIGSSTLYHCSECKAVCWGGGKYCHNCGAKMDGDTDD